MNEIVNKILLAGDKFMSEMHLKQLAFTYSACGPFSKIKKEFKNLKKQEIQNIFIEKLYKACFQASGDFKDLARRTASDKVLRDDAFNIAKNPKHDGYQTALASTVYKFFDKKSTSVTDKSTKRGGVNNEIKQNEQLAEDLHKTVIEKSLKRTLFFI